MLTLDLHLTLVFSITLRVDAYTGPTPNTGI